MWARPEDPGWRLSRNERWICSPRRDQMSVWGGFTSDQSIERFQEKEPIRFRASLPPLCKRSDIARDQGIQPRESGRRGYSCRSGRAPRRFGREQESPDLLPKLWPPMESGQTVAITWKPAARVPILRKPASKILRNREKLHDALDYSEHQASICARTSRILRKSPSPITARPPGVR